MGTVTFSIQMREDGMSSHALWKRAGTLGLAMALVMSVAAAHVEATDYTWEGDENALWTTPGNWDPAGPPTVMDSAVFDPTSFWLDVDLNGAVTLAGAVRFEGIDALLPYHYGVLDLQAATVNSPVKFGGGRVEVRGASTVTGAVTESADVTFGGAGAVTFSDTGGVGLTLDRTWTVEDGVTAAFDGPVTGAVTLTKAGSGVLRLGGLATFDGLPVDESSVLVKYTWYGDANLDGVVDTNDYDMINTAWLLLTTEGKVPDGGFRWGVGDFNHDGTIDTNDYDKINTAWLLQTGPLGGSTGGSAPIPEPATVVLLALGGVAMLFRRKR